MIQTQTDKQTQSYRMYKVFLIQNITVIFYNNVVANGVVQFEEFTQNYG